MADLSTNKKRALAALLSQPTIEKAAAACTLTTRTLYNYLADPDFRAALATEQERTIAAAVSALSGLAGNSIDALRDVITDKGVSPGVRVRAALGILGRLMDLKEFADLERRIAALEERTR